MKHLSMIVSNGVSLVAMQVVNWLEGPGTEQLRTQWGIGDSIRASQALQQKHEEMESQHSVRTE
jgi:hypothetical protein